MEMLPCSSGCPEQEKRRSLLRQAEASLAMTNTVGVITACSTLRGGCYAKTINLSKKAEPEIYGCTHKFGTVLENVVLNPVTRWIDLDDDSLTENTRAGYPVTHLDNIVPEGIGGHPKNLIMLTCDAFGVMPPVAKLTTEQAMYHFLSGYTAKVAGTEQGLGDRPKRPSATVSAIHLCPLIRLYMLICLATR